MKEKKQQKTVSLNAKTCGYIWEVLTLLTESGQKIKQYAGSVTKTTLERSGVGRGCGL